MAASRVHSMPLGGADVDPDQWPPCVREIRLDDEGHALTPLRVVLPEKGGATLILNRLWLLHIGTAPTTAKQWPVTDRIFLTVTDV
jgi:hypothetical protein